MCLYLILLMLHPDSNDSDSAEYFVSLQGEVGSRVVPPLTDNNTADGKIGRAVTIVSVRCYCPDEALEMRRHSGLCNLNSG